MIVTIVNRGQDGWVRPPVTVEIADKCPVCGGKRGKPVRMPCFGDGYYYSVDYWVNPCGHIDKHADVLKEAKRAGEPSKLCPACGEVAGYGNQGWTCTNPVCDWMEQFEEAEQLVK